MLRKIFSRLNSINSSFRWHYVCSHFLLHCFLPLALELNLQKERPPERRQCFDVSQLMNTKLQVSMGWRVTHHMALLIYSFKWVSVLNTEGISGSQECFLPVRMLGHMLCETLACRSCCMLLHDWLVQWNWEMVDIYFVYSFKLDRNLV